MPHIIIEYSANVADHIDIDELVAAVHDAGLEHELVPPHALRTRATARTSYRIADGHPDNAFVAIQVRLAPGRDAATVTGFLTTLLDAAERVVDTTTHPLAVAWSIEAVQIDADVRINRNRIRDRAEGPEETSTC